MQSGTDRLVPGFNNINIDFHFIEPYPHILSMGEVPGWLQHLEDEDYQFIKRFVMASGSLKELDRYIQSAP